MQWHIHSLLREHRFLRCKNPKDLGFWSKAPEKIFHIYLQKVFETSYKFLEVINSSQKIYVKRRNQQRCIKLTEDTSYKQDIKTVLIAFRKKSQRYRKVKYLTRFRYNFSESRFSMILSSYPIIYKM